MGLGQNWYQIGIKICYIPKVSKFYLEKRYLCQGHPWHVKLHFTDQKIMQKGDRMELNFDNFKSFEMQK